MARLGIFGQAVNLGISPMESPIIHLIYHAIHPRAIVCGPVLTLLLIAHKRLMSRIEGRIVATGLRLVKALDQLFLFRGLLLVRRCLLGSERNAHCQQDCGENNLFEPNTIYLSF